MSTEQMTGIPRNQIIGNWSVRAFLTEGQRTGYHVYPVGERSHWAIKATLWPASDGQCFVISMNRHAMDARPSFEAALAHVIGILDRGIAKAPDVALQLAARGEAFD